MIASWNNINEYIFIVNILLKKYYLNNVITKRVDKRGDIENDSRI
jgi:hypothetical protein